MRSLPVAVIGAGIAGLSAAWELARRGAAVMIFEASDRAGGVIASEAVAGFVLEHGADGFLTAKTAATELCTELGLGSDLICNLTSPAGANIWHDGRLEPLPQGWRMIEPGELPPVLASGLFSAEVKREISAHWGNPPEPAAAEESIAAYLRRRWGAVAGQAIADTVAGPMMSGVYGGSAEALTIETVRPRQPRAATTPGASPFTSLRGGMGDLVAALTRLLPAGCLHCNAPVLRVGSVEATWLIELADGSRHRAGAVVVALPAWTAASVLSALDPELAAALGGFEYASSVSINLGYGVAPALPPGSGFLVPRATGYALSACTFAHQKYPGRAPSDGALLRAFYNDDGRPDAELIALAQAELRGILGVTTAPRLIRLHRHHRALPQYHVGHAARVARIMTLAARHPGLALAGNLYQGVGVPDCIASGRAAALSLRARPRD